MALQGSAPSVPGLCRRAGWIRARVKGLVPEDAKEAIGHGVRAKRSKSGAVSFDVINRPEEVAHAAIQ
jgi:hypothetical protein